MDPNAAKLARLMGVPMSQSAAALSGAAVASGGNKLRPSVTIVAAPRTGPSVSRPGSASASSAGLSGEQEDDAAGGGAAGAAPGEPTPKYEIDTQLLNDIHDRLAQRSVARAADRALEEQRLKLRRQHIMRVAAGETELYPQVEGIDVGSDSDDDEDDEGDGGGERGESKRGGGSAKERGAAALPIAQVQAVIAPRTIIRPGRRIGAHEGEPEHVGQSDELDGEEARRARGKVASGPDPSAQKGTRSALSKAMSLHNLRAAEQEQVVLAGSRRRREKLASGVPAAVRPRVLTASELTAPPSRAIDVVAQAEDMFDLGGLVTKDDDDEDELAALMAMSQPTHGESWAAHPSSSPTNSEGRASPTASTASAKAKGIDHAADAVNAAAKLTPKEAARKAADKKKRAIARSTRVRRTDGDVYIAGPPTAASKLRHGRGGVGRADVSDQDRKHTGARARYNQKRREPKTGPVAVSFLLNAKQVRAVAAALKRERDENAAVSVDSGLDDALGLGTPGRGRANVGRGSLPSSSPSTSRMTSLAGTPSASPGQSPRSAGSGKAESGAPGGLYAALAAKHQNEAAAEGPQPDVDANESSAIVMIDNGVTMSGAAATAGAVSAAADAGGERPPSRSALKGARSVASGIADIGGGGRSTVTFAVGKPGAAVERSSTAGGASSVGSAGRPPRPPPADEVEGSSSDSDDDVESRHASGLAGDPLHPENDDDDDERHVEKFWSPVDEYYGKSRRAQPTTSRFSNLTEHRSPAFSHGKQLPIYKPAQFGPPPTKYSTARAFKATSRCRTAPSARIEGKHKIYDPREGVPGPGEYRVDVTLGEGAPAARIVSRPKTQEEIDDALGVPKPSGPLMRNESFSFVAEDKRLNKGVVFGTRLKDRREVEEKLGIRHGPAPGGDIPYEVFSFTAQDAKHKKGIPFGHRPPDRREIDERLGIFHGPAPGGDIPLDVFSFAAQDTKLNKGVPFGTKSDPMAGTGIVGRLREPGPGAYRPEDVHDMAAVARRNAARAGGMGGAVMGDALPSQFEMDAHLGKHNPMGPGGLIPTESFSFAAQAAKERKGVQFGHKLPDRREIDERLGIFHGPAPGGDIPAEVFSFAAQAAKQNRGAKLAGKLPTREDIDAKLGIGRGPAPGGLIPTSSFSFTAQNQRQKKGVVFGSRLKDRREIEEKLGIRHGPAPGGNVPVPSFVEDDKKLNKGAVFGHRLPDRREIDEKLGIFHGPAPGGDIPLEVFSFAAQSKKQNTGVVFGAKFKSMQDMEDSAQQRRGNAQDAAIERANEAMYEGPKRRAPAKPGKLARKGTVSKLEAMAQRKKSLSSMLSGSGANPIE